MALFTSRIKIILKSKDVKIQSYFINSKIISFLYTLHVHIHNYILSIKNHKTITSIKLHSATLCINSAVHLHRSLESYLLVIDSAYNIFKKTSSINLNVAKVQKCIVFSNKINAYQQIEPLKFHKQSYTWFKPCYIIQLN